MLFHLDGDLDVLIFKSIRSHRYRYSGKTPFFVAYHFPVARVSRFNAWLFDSIILLVRVESAKLRALPAHVTTCLACFYSDSYYIDIISKSYKSLYTVILLAKFLVKNRRVSFTSLIMKNIVIFSAWSGFLAKLIWWITLNQNQVLAFCLGLELSISNFLYNKDNLINNQLCYQLFDQSLPLAIF